MTAADVAMVEEAEVLAGAARLLGGARVLERVPKTRLDVHARLREGLPTAALRHLVEAEELRADDDVVDGDVDQLDEEPDEAHDGEADGSGDRDLLELWKRNGG